MTQLVVVLLHVFVQFPPSCRCEVLFLAVMTQMKPANGPCIKWLLHGSRLHCLFEGNFSFSDNTTGSQLYLLQLSCPVPILPNTYSEQKHHSWFSGNVSKQHNFTRFCFPKLQSRQLPEELKFSLKTYICFKCCPSHIMPVADLSVFQRPPVRKSFLRAPLFLSTLHSNGGNRVKKGQCLGKFDTNSNREIFWLFESVVCD